VKAFHPPLALLTPVKPVTLISLCCSLHGSFTHD
jgi:hypothetical protein